MKSCPLVDVKTMAKMRSAKIVVKTMKKVIKMKAIVIVMKTRANVDYKSMKMRIVKVNI